MQQIDELYVLIAEKIGRNYQEDKKLYIDEDDELEASNIISIGQVYAIYNK